MFFRADWCCKHTDVWENTEEGSPCEICPMHDQEIDEFNQFCYERWKFLDITGRDRGFGETPLREEAIDLHLRRYRANDSEVYETIFQIEVELFGHRQEKEKAKQEREKLKANKKKAGGAPPARPSARFKGK